METFHNTELLPGQENPLYMTAFNVTREALTTTVQHLCERGSSPNLDLPASHN